MMSIIMFLIVVVLGGIGIFIILKNGWKIQDTITTVQEQSKTNMCDTNKKLEDIKTSVFLSHKKIDKLESAIEQHKKIITEQVEKLELIIKK